MENLILLSFTSASNFFFTNVCLYIFNIYIYVYHVYMCVHNCVYMSVYLSIDAVCI